MNLPNHENAFVPAAKIDNYLLDENHPIGGPKAKFFRKFGFNESNRSLLEHALLVIARNSEVRQIQETGRGTTYVIIGEIQTPVGRPVIVVTVWIIERNETNPRFVTAYPA